MKLIQGWKRFKYIVEPDIQRRYMTGGLKSSKDRDLISWMMEDAKDSMEKDPWLLVQLSAFLAANATYSTANFVSQALADLIAHPDVLTEVIMEIRSKHAEIGGVWDLPADNYLRKIESAIKETARLSPGTLLIYSRLIEHHHTFSGGLRLHKGDFVAVASHAHNTADETLFPESESWDGLRFYKKDMGHHRNQPFYGFDGDVLPWGSGRWACPGRYIANVSVRILLSKLLDEFDWAFADGKPPNINVFHAFPLFHPRTRLKCLRNLAGSHLGISF